MTSSLFRGPPSRRYIVRVTCPECGDQQDYEADYEGDTGATNFEPEETCPDCNTDLTGVEGEEVG